MKPEWSSGEAWIHVLVKGVSICFSHEWEFGWSVNMWCCHCQLLQEYQPLAVKNHFWFLCNKIKNNVMFHLWLEEALITIMHTTECGVYKTAQQLSHLNKNWDVKYIVSIPDYSLVRSYEEWISQLLIQQTKDTSECQAHNLPKYPSACNANRAKVKYT